MSVLGQSAPTVIPVDDYITEEMYPGYAPAFGSQPFVFEPVRPFTKADNRRYWLRDSLHFGRGMAPASIALMDDAQTWGTQLAADMVGVPPTLGMVNRLAGTHVYLGGIDVTSAWQIQARAARFGSFVEPILRDFDGYWTVREQELRSAFEHFDGLDLAAMEPAELWAALKDAYAFHRRGWYVHFEAMYSLAANYLAFFHLAQELGLDGSLVSRFLAGRRTFYIETDEALWKLTSRARELGVDGALLTGEPGDARARLLDLPNGATWWAELEAFLQKYGSRLEETCTIDTPSWLEDPAPALYRIAAFLTSPQEHDFGAAQAQAVQERDELIDDARSKIGGGPNLERFNDALASNLSANFAWWNDDHNALLDRRLAIPPRRISLALAERLVDDGHLAAPEDIFFLFKSELFDLMDDGAGWARLTALIPDRRAFFEEWRERGRELPPMLGSIPDRVDDPIMTEILGLSEHFIETVKSRDPGRELSGFPASRGVVEGVARVITRADQLHEVQAGEILVCTGTTTEWTPVFGIIKACVCDTGGSLAHAAIVSREYAIPCVVGTAVGTSTIKSGDVIRVDGVLGRITLTG